MLSKRNTTLFAFVLAILVAATLSVNANAGTPIDLRICGKWRSQYVDAGFGEDIFTSTGTVDRKASYASYRVTLASNDSVIIAEGDFDTSGCTPYFNAEDGVQYKIRQGTRFIRNRGTSTRRTAYVQPIQTGTSPTYSNSYVNYIIYYTPSGHSSGQNVTMTNVVNAGFHSNMGPIVDRLLRYANTLDIPGGTVFHMVGCNSGSGFSGDNNMFYKYVAGGTDHSSQKFRVGHEMGHAIGDVGSPRIRWGTNKSHHSNYCNCTGITSGSHCLQSWESTRLAQTEGFCHFISTVLFNFRDDGDGFFGSYRDTRFPNASGPDIWELAPWGVDTTDSVRWMENNCSGWANNGVEWDWLTFFWQVWSRGTNRISIADIRSIWPTDGSPESDYNWYNINASASSQLSTAKHNNFEDVAEDNGVNHILD